MTGAMWGVGILIGCFPAMGWNGAGTEGPGESPCNFFVIMQEDYLT